jgi:hypothetical protein
MNDLLTSIDHCRCECLNSTDDAGNVLKQGYRDDAALKVSSDEDAELLIHVPFTQSISRLSGVAFACEPPSAGPRLVKFFVNNSTLGFTEATSTPAAFSMELEEDQLSQESMVPLPAVKFRNVHTLTIFVESNQSGDSDEKTTISKIVLFGQEGDTFNVANIKDISKDNSS